MPDSVEAPGRTRLPNRRPGLVRILEWQGRELLATFGVDRDGRIREIFFNGEKAGSHIEALLSDAAVTVSLALQYGVPVRALAAAMGWAAQHDPADPTGPGGRTAISPLGEALALAAEIEARDGPLLARCARADPDATA